MWYNMRQKDKPGRITEDMQEEQKQQQKNYEDHGENGAGRSGRRQRRHRHHFHHQLKQQRQPGHGFGQGQGVVFKGAKAKGGPRKSGRKIASGESRSKENRASISRFYRNAFEKASSVPESSPMKNFLKGVAMGLLTLLMLTFLTFTATETPLFQRFVKGRSSFGERETVKKEIAPIGICPSCGCEVVPVRKLFVEKAVPKKD